LKPFVILAVVAGVLFFIAEAIMAHTAPLEKLFATTSWSVIGAIHGTLGSILFISGGISVYLGYRVLRGRVDASGDLLIASLVSAGTALITIIFGNWIAGDGPGVFPSECAGTTPHLFRVQREHRPLYRAPCGGGEFHPVSLPRPIGRAALDQDLDLYALGPGVHVLPFGVWAWRGGHQGQARLDSEILRGVSTLSAQIKPIKPTGEAIAALMSPMLGLFVFSIVSLMWEATRWDPTRDFSPLLLKIGAWIPYSTAIGPYSGRETILLLTWGVSWLILHAILRKKELRILPWAIAFLVGIALSTLLLWAPFGEAIIPE
jgi:hypothetical protein